MHTLANITTDTTVTYERLNGKGQTRVITVLARDVYHCTDGAVIVYGPRIMATGRMTYDKPHVILPTTTIRNISND